MQRLGEVTVLPLVLWLRDLRLSAATERRALLALESYLVRRAAIGASTRAYQQVFRDVLAGAKESLDAGESADLAVEKSLLAREAHAWPKDEEVREAFIGRRYYGIVAGYVIRLLFAGIDERLKTENRLTEQTAVPYDSLTIEHIMPQSWRESWRISAPNEPEQVLAEQRRDAHLHRLGNLTLLNRALNARQSNAPWSEKRLALAEHSALRVNADLATNPAWDSWDEQKIAERAEYLAAVACRAWPRPTEWTDLDMWPAGRRCPQTRVSGIAQSARDAHRHDHLSRDRRRRPQVWQRQWEPDRSLLLDRLGDARRGNDATLAAIALPNPDGGVVAVDR